MSLVHVWVFQSEELIQPLIQKTKSRWVRNQSCISQRHHKCCEEKTFRRLSVLQMKLSHNSFLLISSSSVLWMLQTAKAVRRSWPMLPLCQVLSLRRVLKVLSALATDTGNVNSNLTNRVTSWKNTSDVWGLSLSIVVNSSKVVGVDFTCLARVGRFLSSCWRVLESTPMK